MSPLRRSTVGYRPVVVTIAPYPEPLGTRASCRRPLYPGCDVVLKLDHRLKLRGSKLAEVGDVYALALEHSRHRPRSVHVAGAGLVLREVLAQVIATAYPDVVVTYATPRSNATGPRAARRVPPAPVVLDENSDPSTTTDER